MYMSTERLVHQAFDCSKQLQSPFVAETGIRLKRQGTLGGKGLGGGF